MGEGRVFKAHRSVYHSTLGSRVITKKKCGERCYPAYVSRGGVVEAMLQLVTNAIRGESAALTATLARSEALASSVWFPTAVPNRPREMIGYVLERVPLTVGAPTCGHHTNLVEFSCFCTYRNGHQSALHRVAA